jgi:Mg/Co/Ni transporter MgtE
VVLGAMPTDQLTAMLKMTPPQYAAGVLAAMPTDRVVVLLRSLDPPHLARILAAADPARKVALSALLDIERIAPVLASTSKQQAVQLLAALPDPRALAVLQALPPNWVSVLLTAMAPEPQSRLLEAMHPRRAAEHRAGIYETHVVWALSRTAARVTQITDDDTADVLVEARNWAVHVAIRYQERGLLLLREVVAGQSVINGVPVSGTLIVTNTLSDDILRYAGRPAHGPPVDVVTWRGQSDDGALHRATVQLVHEAGVEG